MKPPCAAKAAAPVRDATWWAIPPAWPAFPSRRTLPNRRAAPSTTDRVRPWNTDRRGRRAVDGESAGAAERGRDAAAAADAATGADRAGHAGSLWPLMNADE